MVTVLESLGRSDLDDFSAVSDEVVGRVVIMHGASADVVWQNLDGTEDAGLCTLAKNLDKTPVAGDWVVVSDARIVSVVARRSELRRPHPYGREPQVMAANVDLVLIVVALNVDLNERVLERLTMMARDSGATPVVIVTKVDDADDAAALCRLVRDQVPDVEIVVTSARTGEGVDEVRRHLPRGVSAVMLGASGVGKTSLLNALQGTEEFTRTVGRGGEGRHATTTRKLYRLSSGGVLLDIPGIRLLDVVADQRSVDQNFADIDELAQACRFHNCQHRGDVGCAVRAALATGALDESRLVAWREAQTGERDPHERRRAGAARPRARAREDPREH